MATDFNPLKDIPWLNNASNIPVPVVDPADLKIVWELQRKVQKEHPGEQIAIDVINHLKACSPGADAWAVWYRLSKLAMLPVVCEMTGRNLPWSQADKPDDFIFKLLATFPMTGTASSGLEELIQAIQREYE